MAEEVSCYLSASNGLSTCKKASFVTQSGLKSFTVLPTKAHSDKLINALWYVSACSWKACWAVRLVAAQAKQMVHTQKHAAVMWSYFFFICTDRDCMVLPYYTIYSHFIFSKTIYLTTHPFFSLLFEQVSSYLNQHTSSWLLIFDAEIRRSSQGFGWLWVRETK